MILNNFWSCVLMSRFRHIVLKSMLSNRFGRWFLALATTTYAQFRTGAKVKVFYDSVWGHVVDGVRIPDSRKFCYYGKKIDQWVGEPSKWCRVARAFWCLKYQPKLGDIVIDVGAGMGSDIFFFSSEVGDTGRVLAIEANPNTFILLTKLVKWNNLRNVECRQFAIIDRPQQIMIEDGDFHEANSLVTDSNAVGAVQVQGVRLDDLILTDNFSKIDFIKMNIEGAETLALEGMKDSLSRTRHVCIACHDFRADRGEGEYFRTRSKVEKVLRDLGFQILPTDTHTGNVIRDHVHGFRIS